MVVPSPSKCVDVMLAPLNRTIWYDVAKEELVSNEGKSGAINCHEYLVRSVPDCGPKARGERTSAKDAGPASTSLSISDVVNNEMQRNYVAEIKYRLLRSTPAPGTLGTQMWICLVFFDFGFLSGAKKPRTYTIVVLQRTDPSIHNLYKFHFC
jgi:hypothetical protein